MNDPGKNKKIALVATAVFHIAVLLILVLSYLHYTDIPMEDDAVQQDITFFGGEYVMLGNALPQQGDEAATSAADEEQANTGDNIDDAGTAGESATPALSTDEQSPMQVAKESEQAGPTKEELAEQERIRRRKEAEERTNRLVQGAFNNSKGNGGGSEGQPDGNSPTGARSGSPGVSGLSAGYTLEHWGNPHSTFEGTVVIRVRVNSRGQVIAANYDSGSGTAASNMDVRRSCEQASRQSRFKVPTGTVSEAIGYITWKFQ